MEDVRNTLAVNIRLARQRAQLSQEDLADKADIDRTYVSGIERRKRNPTIEILARLADALDTTSATLLTKDAFADKAKELR